jgi:hypothetical protein
MTPDSARWADLVYHVLAHVRGTASLPSSVYDPHYVRFAELQLGPASERPLGQDAAHLARAAPTHAELSRVQLLAWLFRDLPRAREVATRALGELHASDVDDPSVLRSVTEASELLWCAALLELDLFATLPVVEIEPAELERGLGEMADVAPGLRECRIELVRALGLRGRVRDQVIWIGAPSAELGVSLDHVLWQAAHEATVRELGLRSAALPREQRPSERELEHAAVVLLAERARETERAPEHRRWLDHFGPHAPAVELGSLSPAARRLL